MTVDTFDADLDAQLKAEPDTFDVDVTINKRFVKLRFHALDGLEWAELAAQCPPNLEAQLDRSYGYNLRSMTFRAGPVAGERIVNGEPVETSPEQWKKLLRGLTGGEIRQIGNALYTLHEYLPTQAVDAARKALAAESAKNSNSPAPSESPTPN